MKHYLLLACLLVLGCAGPGQRDAVFCLHGFSLDHQVLLYQALQEWNDDIGSSLYVGEQSCDVQVYYMTSDSDDQGDEGGLNNHIKIWSGSDQAIRVTMLHEVGHYLANSGKHLSDPKAVMYWKYDGQLHLNANDIAYVNK